MNNKSRQDDFDDDVLRRLLESAKQVAGSDEDLPDDSEVTAYLTGKADQQTGDKVQKALASSSNFRKHVLELAKRLELGGEPIEDPGDGDDFETIRKQFEQKYGNRPWKRGTISPWVKRISMPLAAAAALAAIVLSVAQIQREPKLQVESFDLVLANSFKIGSICEGIPKLDKHFDRLRTVLRGSKITPLRSKRFVSLAPSVVALLDLRLKKIGSGVLISDSGEVLTSAQVVQEDSQFFVVFYDSTFYGFDQIRKGGYRIATVRAIDHARDLALLRIGKFQPASFVHLGDDESLAVAESVSVMGHPDGLSWTDLTGSISKLLREYTNDPAEAETSTNLIQVHVKGQFGSSGSGLFDKSGHLIGIATSFGLSVPDTNFFVRTNELQSFVDSARVGKFAAAPKVPKDGMPLKWRSVTENGEDSAFRKLCKDRNNDGIDDLCAIDVNGDGTVDYYQFDNDYDSYFEIQWHDSGDGSGINYWLIDSDLNGHYDLKGIDEDGDGLPDKVITIQEP